MKPISRDEILNLAAYEQVREHFRARVIAEKKARRVQVGPRASAVFENRDTVLLQIQEMLRTERITRSDAVVHEIDTYNELVPGDGELSVTLMIEIPDKAERDAFLVAAQGLERHVWLAGGAERVGARAVARDGALEDRTTAVHYLKFALPSPWIDPLRSGSFALEIVVDHPAYSVTARLPAATLAALAVDLKG